MRTPARPPRDGADLDAALQLGDAQVVDAIELTLRRTGTTRVRLYGGSMRPTIWPGALLEFVACDADGLRPGDVALIRRGAALVAHRFVGRRGDLVVTRGDASLRDDTPVAAEHVLGRARGLPLGRGTLALPRGLARPAQAAYLRVTPSLTRGRQMLYRIAGPVWRSARDSRLGRTLRDTLSPYAIEAGSPTALTELRRAALSRRRRPSDADIAMWSHHLEAREGSFCLLARTRRRLVGHLFVRAEAEVGHCHGLWLHHTYDEDALGRALLIAAANHARASGRLRTLVIDNERASAAEPAGFEPIGNERWTLGLG